jgi:hypothetical protein
MKEKRQEQKINGWLPKEPNEFKIGITIPMLGRMNTFGHKKARISLVSIGLLFWGLAGFLLTLTQFRIALDSDTTVVINNYWIEVLVLFALGIVAVSYAAFYGNIKKIKKKGGFLTVLATSIIAFFFVSTTALLIGPLSWLAMGNTLGLCIMLNLLVIGLCSIAIFRIANYAPWDRLKPKNLRHQRTTNLKQ